MWFLLDPCIQKCNERFIILVIYLAHLLTVLFLIICRFFGVSFNWCEMIASNISSLRIMFFMFA